MRKQKTADEINPEEYIFMLGIISRYLEKDSLKNVYEYALKIFFEENEEQCKINFQDISGQYYREH